jgi:hypothetical protein
MWSKSVFVASSGLCKHTVIYKSAKPTQHNHSRRIVAKINSLRRQ